MLDRSETDEIFSRIYIWTFRASKLEWRAVKPLCLLCSGYWQDINKSHWTKNTDREVGGTSHHSDVQKTRGVSSAHCLPASGPASVRFSCLLLFSILYMSTVGLIWEFPKLIIFRTLCFVSKNTAKGCTAENLQSDWDAKIQSKTLVWWDFASGRKCWYLPAFQELKS